MVSEEILRIPKVRTKRFGGCGIEKLLTFLVLLGDRSNVGQCQAAVAKAVESFGKIDVLFCCASQGKKTMKRISIKIF